MERMKWPPTVLSGLCHATGKLTELFLGVCDLDNGTGRGTMQICDLVKTKFLFLFLFYFVQNVMWAKIKTRFSPPWTRVEKRPGCLCKKKTRIPSPKSAIFITV